MGSSTFLPQNQNTTGGSGIPFGGEYLQNQWGTFGSAPPSMPMPGMGGSKFGGAPAQASSTGYSTTPAYAGPGGATQQNPGVVPVPGAPNPTSNAPAVNQTTGPQYAGNPTENAKGLGHGQYAVSPQDQGLQNTLFNWLQQQTGQGITPFNLSALLPSGGQTAPGQVASPLDPVSQLLEQFYSTGTSSNPALAGLSQMAQTGDPITAQPEWQAMLAAMNQQQQMGAANTREQLSFTGNLPGSAGALGMSNYETQTALGNDALIAQLAQQSMESAAGRQQNAQNTIASGAQTTGQNLYAYDENAINQLMQEYFQTTPQENPLNQEIFSGATTYPPTFGGKSSAGLIGALTSGAGSILGGAGSLADAGGFAALLGL